MRTWGEPGRPAVVLLHALGCHSGWWAWVGPGLAERGYYIVAPDFRGHGEGPRAETYRFSDHAADVEQLIEAMGSGPVVLAGHSMGGYVALEVAARGNVEPGRVFVADMKTGATPEELEGLRAASARPGRTYATLEEAVGRYKLAPPDHCVPPDRLAEVATECFRAQDGAWVERFDRRAMALEPLDPFALVQRAACPIRFVRGEHSSIMPAEAAADLARAAGADLLTLPGLYHHLPLEAPVVLTDRLVDFLEGR